MKISEILKNKKTTVSFEFFPPKNEESETVLFDTIESLKHINVDFASVTFGAGGQFADKTLDWIKKITEVANYETMMHLTCIGFSEAKLTEILSQLKESNVENVLALRGDIPQNTENFPNSRDFAYASDMTKFINEFGGFCIGGAGYPEKHPEATSLDKDIEHLKIKVDNGAEFIVTQLFFDNEKFYRFRDLCDKAKINVPIVAGIMPVVNASQVIKFTDMCGATLPKGLLNAIEGKDNDYVQNVGIEFASDQCQDLRKNDVAGLHFYTLNRSSATKSVLANLNIR